MAATSWPPNAGFHAHRRALSSTSSATASPVSPAPRRAAARDATSRPHAVLGARIAHGATPFGPAADGPCDVFLDRVDVERDDGVGTPRRELGGGDVVEAECDDVTVDGGRELRRGAEQLARDVTSVALDHDRDRGTGDATRLGDGRGVGRVVEGGVERAPLDEELDGLAHLLVERAAAARPARASPRGLARHPPTWGCPRRPRARRRAGRRCTSGAGRRERRPARAGRPCRGR